MRFVRTASLVLAAVIALAGCTNGKSPSPSASKPAPSAPASAPATTPTLQVTGFQADGFYASFPSYSGGGKKVYTPPVDKRPVINLGGVRGAAIPYTSTLSSKLDEEGKPIGDCTHCQAYSVYVLPTTAKPAQATLGERNSCTGRPGRSKPLNRDFSGEPAVQLSCTNPQKGQRQVLIVEHHRRIFELRCDNVGLTDANDFFSKVRFVG